MSWLDSSGGRGGTPRPPPTSGPPTSWSTRCAGAPPPGRASASTSSTSPRTCARRRSRSIRTTRPQTRAAGTSLRLPSEDLGELGGRSDLELVVPAVRRPLVGTPAGEDGRMPEAGALQVVVLHLADALDPKRLPGEILALAPAAGRTRHPGPSLKGAGPLPPRMRHEGIFAQRLELQSQPPSLRHRERRGHAHVVERSLRIVEPEQQRADPLALTLLVPAEAGDDAVRGAHVLHL